MTHGPDFCAESRRRKSAPTSGVWSVCHTDLVPDFSGSGSWLDPRRSLDTPLVPDSGAGRLRVLFRADFWYARDYYGDR